MRKRIKHTWRINDTVDLLFEYRNWIIAILFIVVLILYGIWVWMNNSYATKGNELFELMEELNKTKHLNAQLKEEILHEAALSTIRDKAYSMGFVESTDKDYIYFYE